MLATLRRVAFAALVAGAYLLIFLPVVFVVVTSFFSAEIVSFPPEGWTLHWYVNAWERRDFVRGLFTTCQVALLATAIGVPLGTAAALALVRSGMRMKSAVSGLLLAPLTVPAVVSGAALYMGYFRAENLIDQDITGTLAGLTVAHVLLTIPWTVRLVTASLQGMDGAIEEAAASLGANGWTTFWRITLPALRPGIVAASLFSFIASFENLEISMFLVGPDRTTLPVAMLNYMEFRMDPTLAAAASVQILLIAVLMWLTDRYVKLSRVI